MKLLPFFCLFFSVCTWAQIHTGTITQTGSCNVAGVIGNPTIVCENASPEVIRLLNKTFAAELKSRDTQIQKLTRDANEWKDRYVDLSDRISQPGITSAQKTEAETLLKEGKLNEVSTLLSTIDKKLDNLSARIDCSGATTEAFALAIKALDANRVITLWRCRPEDTLSTDVQGSFVMLFTSEQFPAAKSFLNQLVAGGLNPLKDMKPLPGPTTSATEAGMHRARYFYVPVYRPLLRGNLDAIQWIIEHAPPGYWTTYDHLMEDITGIMGLPYTRFPVADATQAITMLRKAGVPIDTHDYKAFRDAYQKWLETQTTSIMQEPPPRLTGAAATYAREMAALYPSSRQSPKNADLWYAVSNALAPNSADLLRREKSQTVADMTSGDVKGIDQKVKLLTDELEHQTWWRKLPETQATLYEARRRQNIEAVDSYGYVPVAPGDLRDTDLLPSSTRVPIGYPDCICWTAADLRNQLAEASKRKELLLQFQAKYSN
jgi:hypothetical protein